MSLVAAHIWALALLPIFVLAWWRYARHGHGRWWRLALLICLLAAAVNPQLRWGGDGSDVILILDRSASMGDVQAQQDELLRIIADQRQRGDRLAVIAVGDQPQVLQGPQHEVVPDLSASNVDGRGSDLRGALERAAALIDAQRSVRLVIHSDGEFSDRDPRPAATDLALRGARIDALPLVRPADADAAILAVEIPASVHLGAALQGSVRLLANRSCSRHYRISNGPRLVAEGEIDLQAGRPLRIPFIDRPTSGGLQTYVIELGGASDSRPGNDRAVASLRVLGGERILVMSGDGSPGNIHRALETAGMSVRSIAEGPLSMADLSRASALVLDQVPADRLGRASMLRIERWVRHLGGSLLFCGGRRSFGGGGYHRSPIEAILPVTMELRDEHRKLSVAMAIALDRSGSMAAPVGNGQTKMDLADRGAAAAVELLGPRDAVAVYAVDSAPHLVVPLQLVENPAAITADILRIESMGGGIYVYEALAAAAETVLTSDRSTRHIVIFADAADAEQPGDYRNLLAELGQAGVTVSVIGLGRETDVDAEFLKDVARRGGGRCLFTDDAADLPRLFAQETVLVARSAWIEEPCPLQVRPSLSLLLGRSLADRSWPQVDGYNLSYLRPEAQELLACAGDPQAPALAAWHCGSGRSMSLALACDDRQFPAFAAWPGAADLLSGSLRWLAADGGSPVAEIDARLVGSTAVIDIAFDPALRDHWPDRPPAVELVGDDGSHQRIEAMAIDDGRYQTTIPLLDDRVIMPAIVIDGRSVVGTPLQLPYAPEHAPRFGLEDGDAVLADLARRGNGALRSDLLDCFDNPPSPGGRRSLAPILIIAALLILLAEVACRRLHLSLPRWRRSSAKAPAAKPRRQAPAPAERPAPIAAATTTPAQPQPEPSPTADADTTTPAAQPPEDPPDRTGMAAAMAELRRRRKR